MKYLRWLLFPVSLVYAVVTMIRNWCYDMGWFKSTEFAMPVISVGNLDVGGAGKTPMTEYLIRLLKTDHQLATLSRGYGRETKGFLTVTSTATATQVGDEPAQLKHKFPYVDVAVCEDRVAGATRLQADNDIIILDDAYQHRAIKPGFSLLLFDHQQLQQVSMMLPAGNRRELYYGRKRADVIIVTKCPSGLGLEKQDGLRRALDLYPHQQLFFTGITYLPLKKDGQAAELKISTDTTVFLLTGIANPAHMYDHIAQSGAKIIHHKYPDHHQFSLKNIAKLADDVKGCTADKKIIITTEKDMQRLGEQELLPLINKLPIYTLPIGVAFLNNGGEQFDTIINNYVRKYTAHRAIH